MRRPVPFSTLQETLAPFLGKHPNKSDLARIMGIPPQTYRDLESGRIPFRTLFFNSLAWGLFRRGVPAHIVEDRMKILEPFRVENSK